MRKSESRRRSVDANESFIHSGLIALHDNKSAVDTVTSPRRCITRVWSVRLIGASGCEMLTDVI